MFRSAVVATLHAVRRRAMSGVATGSVGAGRKGIVLVGKVELCAVDIAIGWVEPSL